MRKQVELCPQGCFYLLTKELKLWSSFCGEIGSKKMLSAWLLGGNWMHILCGTNICRGRKGASCENKLHRMWTSCAVWRLFSAQTLSAWLLGGNWMHILCGTNIYRGRKGADIYFQHIQTFIFSKVLPTFLILQFLALTRKPSFRSSWNRKLANFDFLIFFEQKNFCEKFFLVKNYEISDFVDSSYGNKNQF